MSGRILILDLNSILHSVKFSLAKHRLSHKEKPTFVIYGFLLKLHFLLRKTNADIVVYACDSSTSKRKEIYSLYKEKRQQNKTDEQIALDKISYPQFEEIIKYVVPTLGYRNVFKAEGFEADDVIGKLCKRYKNEEIIICSTDQDMYQLLSNNICIFDPKKNNWYTISNFEKDYGIEPKMWKRVKAIGGCKSDNVEGVPIPQTDSNKKQMHVAEKGALNFIKGTMSSTTKAYQAIVSKEGRKVINRNKALVILPFKDTPEFSISQDRLREGGLLQVIDRYGFESIKNDFRNFKQTLRLK